MKKITNSIFISALVISGFYILTKGISLKDEKTQIVKINSTKKSNKEVPLDLKEKTNYKSKNKLETVQDIKVTQKINNHLNDLLLRIKKRTIKSKQEIFTEDIKKEWPVYLQDLFEDLEYAEASYSLRLNHLNDLVEKVNLSTDSGAINKHLENQFMKRWKEMSQEVIRLNQQSFKFQHELSKYYVKKFNL